MEVCALLNHQGEYPIDETNKHGCRDCCSLKHLCSCTGTTNDWRAWKDYTNKSAVCYVYSDASSKKPERLDHGRATLFVRRLNRGKVRTEASLQVGYEFAPTAIRIAVDGKRFTMIPRGNYAWLRRTEREAEFAQALEKGRMAIVEATSRRGNRTTYSFPLKGFTAVMKKARQGCR